MKPVVSQLRTNAARLGHSGWAIYYEYYSAPAAAHPDAPVALSRHSTVTPVCSSGDGVLREGGQLQSPARGRGWADDLDKTRLLEQWRWRFRRSWRVSVLGHSGRAGSDKLELQRRCNHDHGHDHRDQRYHCREELCE